jgi:hypothetical protein
MDDWFIRLVPVPADGSCFFSSIAIALNESVESWKHHKKIKEMLKTHWHNYLSLGFESPDNFTPKFIRYITSMNIDDDDLSWYNDIAQADGKNKMDTADDLAEHVLLSDCWVDTTMFGAFLKSLDCRVAVVVLDHELKQPLNIPDNLTKDKDFYICLWLQDDHYQPMQLVYKTHELGALVSRDSIRKFMEDCYPGHMKRF